MIVVDASALLEVLLRTPSAQAVEGRLLDPQETLHTPHLLDIEVAQVIRRYAANGAVQPSPISRPFLCTDTPMTCCCLACGNCGTISPPMTPYTLLSPKRSM